MIMQKLLTIVIPTYNRAQMLDQQLTRLAEDIKGYESDCEIMIFDNCSSDETKNIVIKWQLYLSKSINFTYNCHERNMGGMANIVASIKGAAGKYVWTLGDDDGFEPGTVAYIVNQVKQHPSLSLILLNGLGRDVCSNQVTVDQWFDSTSDRIRVNRESEYQYFLDRNMGGVLFISSAVYDTKLVQQSLQIWQNSHTNLAAQAYWTGYCAAMGDFLVTRQKYTECSLGIGFTDKDAQWTFKMQFMGIPEVYLRLLRVGYSSQFCLKMINQNFVRTNSWKILVGALRRWPLLASKGIFKYLLLVAQAYRLVFIEKIASKASLQAFVVGE